MGGILSLMLDEFAPEDKHPDQWNIKGLDDKLVGQFGLSLSAAGIDPRAGDARDRLFSGALALPGGLDRLFAQAGLQQVESQSLTIRMNYASFEDQRASELAEQSALFTPQQREIRQRSSGQMPCGRSGEKGCTPRGTACGVNSSGGWLRTGCRGTTATTGGGRRTNSAGRPRRGRAIR